MHFEFRGQLIPESWRPPPFEVQPHRCRLGADTIIGIKLGFEFQLRTISGS